MHATSAPGQKAEPGTLPSTAPSTAEAPLGELQDDYYQCAVDAFRRGDAFFVVFDRQGIDSRTRIAWASNGEFVWYASYDGDPCGGDGCGAEIYEHGCADPEVRENNTAWPMMSPGQESVRCEEIVFREKVCP